ncbi:MAG: nucleotidyltransferase domain-containing protein [Bacteroidales bacterium]
MNLDDQQSHWRWRNDMIEAIAHRMDLDSLGVKALYLIGSVKTGQAGPCSDIDLLAHCVNDKRKQELLAAWCKGSGHSLAVINEEKTGFSDKDSLIDLHIITDADIEKGSPFAAMLESVNNPARLLRKCKEQ